MKYYLKKDMVQTPWKPEYAHPEDAGIDFRTPVGFTLPAGQSIAVDTGVCVEIPDGCFGKIESKSGLNVNHAIVCCGGVIDEGYTGTITARIYNFGEDSYHFNIGDKIFQLVIQPCLHVRLDEVDEPLTTAADRKENGYGSTGR